MKQMKNCPNDSTLREGQPINKLAASKKSTMHRELALLTISLMLLSLTGPKHYQRENWYKESFDSTKPNIELIYQAFYNSDGVLEKENSFNLSNTLYKKSAFFDSVGNMIHEISFYDSSQLYGYEFLNKYDDDHNVLEQVLYRFENGERIDSSKLFFSYLADSLDKIVRAKGTNDMDTSVVVTEYVYYQDGLLKNLITKSMNDTFLIQTYEYDEYENVTLNSQELIDQGFLDVTYFTYTDSLLTERIQVFNEDTIKIEKYEYQEGLKKHIEVSELKEFEFEKYRINIEYE